MSKVMISLPEAFLYDIDTLAKVERRTRSELVREALRTYVTSRGTRAVWTPGPDVRRAARRILATKLKLPAGETAESIVRKMRETRYGHGWVPASLTPR